MGFFKTLFTGYKLLFQDINRKHNDLFPRCFTGCGTGLMMIGSAVMAKTGMKEDVQQVIAEANAAVDEAQKVREGEKKPERAKRILKAKAVKGWKVVKAFHKGIIMETVGAASVGVGYGMAEKGKHRAIKAVGALGAAFASYRAAVREDLGDEADRRYLTGQKAFKRTEKINKKTGEITEDIERVDDGSLNVDRDPNAFRLLINEETSPNVWSANYYLRKSNLEWIQDTLTRKLQHVGHLSLNDMRREFAPSIDKAEKMDVDIGGIFGRVLDPNIPVHLQTVNLHFEDDKDFMEGRKDWCWVIFDCDKESIIGRYGKKIKQVET